MAANSAAARRLAVLRVVSETSNLHQLLANADCKPAMLPLTPTWPWKMLRQQCANPQRRPYKQHFFTVHEIKPKQAMETLVYPWQRDTRTCARVVRFHEATTWLEWGKMLRANFSTAREASYWFHLAACAGSAEAHYILGIDNSSTAILRHSHLLRAAEMVCAVDK